MFNLCFVLSLVSWICFSLVDCSSSQRLSPGSRSITAVDCLFIQWAVYCLPGSLQMMHSRLESRQDSLCGSRSSCLMLFILLCCFGGCGVLWLAEPEQLNGVCVWSCCCCEKLWDWVSCNINIERIDVDVAAAATLSRCPSLSLSPSLSRLNGCCCWKRLSISFRQVERASCWKQLNNRRARVQAASPFVSLISYIYAIYDCCVYY